MISIEGSRITISDDIHGSNYRAGKSDFEISFHSGETVHIPIRALRFALSVIANAYECRGFADLWSALDGGSEFAWHESPTEVIAEPKTEEESQRHTHVTVEGLRYEIEPNGTVWLVYASGERALDTPVPEGRAAFIRLKARNGNEKERSSSDGCFVS